MVSDRYTDWRIRRYLIPNFGPYRTHSSTCEPLNKWCLHVTPHHRLHMTVSCEQFNKSFLFQIDSVRFHMLERVKTIQYFLRKNYYRNVREKKNFTVFAIILGTTGQIFWGPPWRSQATLRLTGDLQMLHPGVSLCQALRVINKNFTFSTTSLLQLADFQCGG